MSLHHQDRHTERHTSYSTYELAPRAAKHWSNHFSLKHHLHFVSICSQFEAQGFMQSGLAFFHFDKQAFLFPKEAWQSSLHRHSSWASSLPQHWATSRISLMTSYAQGIQHRWADWYNQRVYIKENVPACQLVTVQLQLQQLFPTQWEAWPLLVVAMVTTFSDMVILNNSTRWQWPLCREATLQ